MKRFWLSTVLFVVCTLIFSLAVNAQSYPTFTTFTTDPMDADGIYGAELQQYIDNGWQVRITTAALVNQLVQFRNHATGVPEWRVGTIPPGTIFIINTTIGEARIQVCGNIAGDSGALYDISSMYPSLNLPSE